MGQTSGLCCANGSMARLLQARTDVSFGGSDGYAERGVAVQDGDPNLELSNQTV